MIMSKHSIKCKSCENFVKRNWSSPTKWSTYCSAKCRANDPDFQNSIKEKYGEHPGHTKEAIEKRKRTCVERYGSEFPLQNEHIHKQTYDTSVERYGGILRGSSIINDKISDTMIQRYGVEYSGLSSELLEKQQITNLQRYGVKHPLQNDQIKNRMIVSNMEKYGVGFISQLKIKDKLPLISDYQWLYNKYINERHTASSIADELGDIYYGTILNHIRKLDIEITSNYGFSISAIRWIESIIEQEGVYIQHALNDGEYQIPSTKYKADGYCQETNTIYEFHGDYWHGNPLVYESTDMNEIKGVTMGELYQKTIDKENIIRKLGYNLIVKWESELQHC